MTIAIKTSTSPTLSSGAFTVTFGNFEKVAAASVVFDAPLTSDYVYDAVVTYATNVVTVTVKKMQISATNTWGDADTADVATKVFTIIADCI